MELEAQKYLKGQKRLRSEAKLLLDAVPDRAKVIVLDERGKLFSSVAFAKSISALRDEGIADVAFLIGGAEGLHQELIKTANLVLSLGPMTWPHLMVRALLMEQLYRAHTILAGHPYHRG